jgi:hypothetical protein
MNREAIYSALFQLLNPLQWVQDGSSGLWNLPARNPEYWGDIVYTEGGVITFERRLRHWNDVPKEEQPYMCVTQGSESHQTLLPGQRDRVMIRPKIYIYASTAGGLEPGPIINPILDAVQTLFSPDRADPMQQKQTLGGLVEHARIDGEIVTFEGTLGDQEVAFIPLELLVVTG